jgi:diguanylate cyclase (GGDEF)-like protein
MAALSWHAPPPSPPTAGRKTRRQVSRIEFWTLAGLEGVIGLVAAAFAAFPPVASSPVLGDAWLALALVVLGLITGLAGPYLGFGAMLLVVLATFAAYCLPRMRAGVLVVWMLVLYSVALAVNPRMPSRLYLVVTWFVVAGVAVTVSVLVDRLVRMAVRDPLTGLLNRRGLEDRFGAVVAAARRSGRPVVVAAIDLDDFKGCNDRLGHSGGDALLTDLAAAWQSVLRGSDILGRTGGDEFLVVLPDMSVPESEQLLARMRSAHPAPWSVGVVEWAPDEPLFVTADRADQLLYEAKAAKHDD